MNLFKKQTQPETNLWRSVYSENGSLNLAAAISAEIARLVTLELKSSIYGSKRAEFINTQYQDVIKNAYNFCEIACAAGGVMLKPYIYDGRIMTAYLPQDSFEITHVGADGTITGAKFYEQIQKGSQVFRKCEEHIPEDGGYLIRNTVWQGDGVRKKQIDMQQVDEWADIKDEVRLEGVKKPLFAYFKMPFINPKDLSTPMGAPVFARCVQLIHDAQKQYERLLWEFDSGERALYLDETAVKRNIKGEVQLPDKRLYRLLNTGSDDLFCDWTPQIRDEAIINGLERILQRIEFNCGLAYGTLSDPQTVDKTAEEIRSSKQRSYATVTQIQRAMKDALLDWLCAADTLCRLYDICDDGECRMDIMFDDSIITDRQSEFSERMQLLKEGVINKEEMRRWYLGENEGGIA